MKDDKKISLPELPEYGAPTDFDRLGVGDYKIVNSRREWGGLVFEWPGIFYVTRSQVIRSYLMNRVLASRNLPYYPYLYYAIEKEVGIKPGNSHFGKVIAIVPDYRARVSLTIRSKNKIKVELDAKIEKPENFLSKYYCVTEKGEVCQGDLVFRENEKEIEFQNEIKEFNLCLLTKEDEIIDWKNFYSRYSTEPGVSIEHTPENMEFIIKNGENEHVEFKREISKNHKEFVESIVAFANKKGGVVFLGVNDNCNILGVTPEDLDKDRIYSIVRDNCDPAIEIDVSIIKLYDKELVLIEVPEGKDKPYLVKDKGLYIRVGSSDRVMTRAELDQVYKKH